MPAFRRRRKLPKRRLQLKLTFIFAGLVVLGLTMQHLLFVKEMTMLAEELPNDGAHVVESVNQLTLTALLATIACIVPITLVVGVLTTFRIAGPVYRLERHLGAIARGEDPGPCRLRKGDELKELCGAVNAAVAKLREPRPQGAAAPPAPAAPTPASDAPIPSDPDLTAAAEHADSGRA